MFLHSDSTEHSIILSETKHRRIGIMGGTFNPIHNGHLSLAQSALEHFQLDEILFMPSGVSWMKRGTDILDSSLRLKMTELAIKDTPQFSVSTIEIERAGNTYTYETILSLKKQNPDTEYYFIMGADSLFSFENWKNPEIILDNCTLLVAVRDDYDMNALKKQILHLKKRYKAEIEVLTMQPIDISSSEIRQRVKNGDSIQNLMPAQVEQFILKNHLYV